jgi:hypothetical protein
MAVAYIQEFAIRDRSTANYDHVKESLGDDPIEGLIAHTAGFDDEDGVFRNFDVWESRKQAERFYADRIQPMIDQGPEAFPRPESFTPPTRDGYYDLHDVVS